MIGQQKITEKVELKWWELTFLSFSWSQRKYFQLFTIEYDASCRFVIYGLCYAEVCTLYAHFLERFYHKCVLNFVKSFFCIYWDDHVVFILPFGDMVYHTYWFVHVEMVASLGFPCGSVVKGSAHNAGDLGLIPGLGRSPGEGKGHPLQYSGLENSMDCIESHLIMVRDLFNVLLNSVC